MQERGVLRSDVLVDGERRGYQIGDRQSAQQDLAVFGEDGGGSPAQRGYIMVVMFVDQRQFPFLADLRANWMAIRDECLALPARRTGKTTLAIGLAGVLHTRQISVD